MFRPLYVSGAESCELSLIYQVNERMSMWQKHVQNLCTDSEECFRNSDYSAALELYREAESLLPTEIEDHPEATTVLTAMADCYFHLEQFEEADAVLRRVIRCPDGSVNSFIRLRRGQVALKLGRKDQAYQELTCAFMNEGDRIFEGESAEFQPIFDEIIEWGKNNR